MEHILISPGKLKLMLTKEDLAHYELDHALDDGAVDTSRLAFRTLLADAGRLSGFDAGGDKLFIQLYPSKDGGAEIYITRLGRPRAEESSGPEYGISDERVKLEHIGVFDKLGDLLECCRRLLPLCEAAEDCVSSAWSDGKRYFLIIGESLRYRDYLDAAKRGRIEAVFGEYGRNIGDAFAISYVKEHCFNFCEKKAVKILADMV